MSVLKIQVGKTEREYYLSIDDAAMVRYESHEATWDAIYRAVKDIDFTTQNVELNGLTVTSIDRLVLLVKYML